MVDLHAKIALILTTELTRDGSIRSLFRPDNIVEVSPRMDNPINAPAMEQIRWYAKNDRGEMVICIGMSLREFYEQHQKGNTVVDENPRLSAFGAPARFIHKKFTVMSGGR